jgi:hypothetical protein
MCHTISVKDSDFIIIKRERQTPSIGMCQQCRIKFFTLRGLTDDPTEAEWYLRGRFTSHKCKHLVFPILPNKKAVNQ